MTIHRFSQPQNDLDLLHEVLRDGARKMLIMALNEEVEEYLAQYRDKRDQQGRRLVVRNGKSAERIIQIELGPMAVSCPRVNDRRIAQDGAKVNAA